MLLQTVPTNALASSLAPRAGELPVRLRKILPAQFTLEELKEAKKDVEELDVARRRAETELKDAKKDVENMDVARRRAETKLAEAQMRERFLAQELAHEKELRRRIKVGEVDAVKKWAEDELTGAQMRESFLNRDLAHERKLHIRELEHERELRRRSDVEAAFLRKALADKFGFKWVCGQLEREGQ